MRLFDFAAALCIAVVLLLDARQGSAAEPTFADDVALLKKHFEIVVLSQGDARVAVCPALEGRVMTSSANGDNGRAFGFINRELIESGKKLPHINAYGGEDRFWMGPEGGQFALFFKKGDAFDLKNWQTPPLMDTEPYDTVPAKGDASRTVAFRKRAKLTNYSGTEFDVQIDRQIILASPETAAQWLGLKPAPAVKLVAYESRNEVTNESDRAWSKETGLLSIWILGMFKPGPQTTVVIPFKPGPVDELGPKVIDDYFGKVPADRLVVRDRVLFFNGDGKFRSKIGITPQRALPVAGSFDARAGVLTIVQYTKPAGAVDYVNSKWEIQKEPYRGDAVNSYNDGPPAPGAKPLGPFYEVETSSPAYELGPGKSMEHAHRTIHLQGSEADLDPIAKALLGVSIEEIKTALPR